MIRLEAYDRHRHDRLGISLTEEQSADLRTSDLAQATEGLDERLSKARGAGTLWMP